MKRNIRLVCFVFTVLMVLLAFTACGEAQLETPTNIQYDGSSITWTAVENADSYKVQINDGTEYDVPSTMYGFAGAGNVISVKITAVSKNAKYTPSETAAMTFQPLEKITDLTVGDAGDLTWTVVPGATAYIVRVNGQDKETVATPSYTNLAEGKNTVQVRPIVQGNSSYYSTWSEAKTVNILGTISKNDISYSDGAISWRYLSNAAGYQVRVNGQIIAEKNIGTSIAYDAQNVDFEVTIKAVGDQSTYFDGKESEAKRFIYLDTVTNMVVEDGVIKWEAISGATGYKVRLNNVEQSHVLTETKLGLESNRTYSVEIKPISTDTTYFSSWSSPKSVLILPAPVVKWNSDYELNGEANNNVYWDSVSSAAGYTVRLTKPNGEVVTADFGQTQRNFAEAYLDVGMYTVEVKSVANNSGTVFDSIYSEPIYITRLAAPKPVADNYITSDPSQIAGGFTVTFQGVAGASGYRLYKDGNEIQSGTRQQFMVGNVIDVSVTAEQEFNYSIQSLGSVGRGGKDIKLSSLPDDSLNFKITVLATPGYTDIAGYIYSWGSVQSAAGYSISTGAGSYTSVETQYDLSGLTAGNHEIRVCSRGNGSDILPSNYTTAIIVRRLEAPTNARIDTTEAAEGQLTFDGVEHAAGYEIVYNNNNNPLPIETQSNINSMITTEGTTIYLQTKANYFNAERTVYYMSSAPGKSYNFIKFVAPTGLKFTNTELIWNPPANINTSIYAPTYEIYYPDGTTYNGIKNGTAMDISYLPGGQEYTFLVKAIGNGSSYINSGKSEPVTVYKLAKPEITRVDGKYVWEGVRRATGYIIYVDGVAMQTYTHEAGKVYEFTPKFDELKSYTVEVQAIGDGGLSVINSDKTVLIQQVRQLATPEFSISYSDFAFSTTGTIDVTITKLSPDATGYSYSFDGVERISTETTYSYNPNGTGTVKVRVYALGGTFDADGVYCLASQSVGGTQNYSITLLPAINKDNLKLSAEGTLKWTAVSGATGYNVEIYHNGVLVQSQRVTTSSIDIEDFEKFGTWTIRISCDGNNTNVIDSQATEVEFVF